jgi:hypothetical protein
MDADDKSQAESALRELCLGKQIVGVRWYAFNFFIEIESVNTQLPHAWNIALLLTVESRWTVFPAWPVHLPEREQDLPNSSLEERVVTLARLAGQDIVGVRLGDDYPHLILTFDSGSVFFLNGYHDSYECWNLSSVGAPDNNDWLIVAVPGGEVAIFAPRV